MSALTQEQSNSDLSTERKRLEESLAAAESELEALWETRDVQEIELAQLVNHTAKAVNDLAKAKNCIEATMAIEKELRAQRDALRAQLRELKR